MIKKVDWAAALRNNSIETTITPEPPIVPETDAESIDVWGFRDTKFVLQPNGSVILTGKRYMLSGLELPALVPWVREVFGMPVSLDDTFEPHYPTEIAESRAHVDQLTALGKVLKKEQIVIDGEVRLRHGHGHAQSEVFAIRYSKLDRIPDVVVFPETEQEVVEIVKAAAEHDICLIPYGGGTNVSKALVCPQNEARTIVSVDLAKMNRILSIDPINRTARVQAGAVGRVLQEQCMKHGFTIGHEPDSIEFSTLGGWIATNASGMKKNKYGNIEDLVLDVKFVTANGIVSRSCVPPRDSVGSDLRSLVFGSEGCLGIITEATIKLFDAPEVQRYGSVIFPDFQHGLEFMYDLTQRGLAPASVRLVDNQQLQLNFVLKPKTTGLGVVKSAIEKFMVSSVYGYDIKKMVACTLVFEGRREEVDEQEDEIYDIAKSFKGLRGGATNGERGYMLTYGIAYIRDFILKHWILAESFETSVAWDKAVVLIDRVKARLAEEHKLRGLPGKPFTIARVSQVYQTGVCVYFYFAFYFKGVADPSGVYHELECAARDEILKAGGSLSHHHGVGKLRTEFLPRVMSDAAIDLRTIARDALDPKRIFGARNLEGPPLDDTKLPDGAPPKAPESVISEPTAPNDAPSDDAPKA